MHHYSEFGYVIDRSIWLSPKEYALLHGLGLQTLYNKKSSGELVHSEDDLLTDDKRWYIHKDAAIRIKNRRPTGGSLPDNETQP